MIVSYKWLQFYFDEPLPSPEELIDLLVKHSFEIEGVEKVGDDTAIDIDVLPNRAHDALSHLGIAREIAVILDRDLKMPPTEFETGSEKIADHLDIKVEDSELVPRVTKGFAYEVKIGPSPDWLVEHLATVGQKSINNVVDITNFIMFETGQPVHAFDYAKLAGEGSKLMEVRKSKSGEPLTLLDGQELEMDDVSLVWADSEKALDLAGIKGGNNSGVDENTTKLVLSACNFEPYALRKTRQRHKVMTDASKRFENHLTPEMTIYAMKRLAVMLAEFAGAEIADFVDVYPKPQEEAEARFKTVDVNRLSGTKLSDGDVEEILNRYRHAGFTYKKEGDEYVVAVPAERLDVRALHEIVEEIVRMHGYFKIDAVLPSKEDFTPKVNKTYYYNFLLKKHLVARGFSEVYNYVMGEKGEIELANSLVEGMGFARSSQLDSLSENLKYNMKNIDVLGLDQLLIFELNKVINMEGENWSLGIAIKNTKDHKGAKEKEIIDELIVHLDEALGAKAKWTIEEREEGLVAEANIEEWIADLPTPDSYGDVLEARSNTQFKPYSAYPPVLRDIALWTPVGTTADEVHNLIKDLSGELLVQSRLFDEFSKDDRTSYAYKMAFQSMERTLTDTEVGEIMDKMTETLNAKEGFEVR